jgi:hypothetical protein
MPDQQKESTMAAKETVVIAIHGANQAKKTESENKATWEAAFSVEADNYEMVVPLMNGEKNDDVAAYHNRKHAGSDFPAYVGWKPMWYGNVWRDLKDDSDNMIDSALGERLNAQPTEMVDECQGLISAIGSKLEAIERQVMQKHFDELVPFYELAVIEAQGQTLYSAICEKALRDIVQHTDGGEEAFLLLAHSMGCAVSFNVLSHLTHAREGQPLTAIAGALSPEYEALVHEFANKNVQCFGLATFGNYTGYDFTMKLNARILTGEARNEYQYPTYCPWWYNFFTVLGGDPYVLDDKLDDDVIDHNDEYDDVPVWRVPFTGIGHSLDKWFARDSFVRGLRKRLRSAFYAPAQQ